MAIFTPGPAVGQISGRVGGTVFSHNKGGPYLRNGAIPIASHTVVAEETKSRLTACSQAWGALTDTQRSAWRSWAQNNPVTNRLGHQVVLSGLAAYNMLNTRLLRAGDAVITTPPIAAPPAPLLTFSATWDIGIGTTVITFTTAPLGADARLWLEAAVLDKPGVSYIENTKRLVVVTAKAQATGYDYSTVVEAVFGALAVGKRVFLIGRVFDSTTGLISGALRDDGVVTSAA